MSGYVYPQRPTENYNIKCAFMPQHIAEAGEVPLDSGSTEPQCEAEIISSSSCCQQLICPSLQGPPARSSRFCNFVQDSSFENIMLQDYWLAINTTLSPFPASPEIDLDHINKIAHTGQFSARLQPKFTPGVVPGTGSWEKAYLAQWVPLQGEKELGSSLELQFFGARFDRRNGLNCKNNFSLRTSAFVFLGDVRNQLPYLNEAYAVIAINILEGVPNQVSVVEPIGITDIKVKSYDFESYSKMPDCCSYQLGWLCDGIESVTVLFVAEEVGAKTDDTSAPLFGGVWYIDDVILT